MNLRTLTAKLKAFFSAAKALALGLFFKSRRGVEWHRLTLADDALRDDPHRLLHP